MSNNQIDQIVVSRGLSLEELLTRMDQAASGILLSVDDAGVLERTITDGDLRRLVLSGVPLTSIDIPLAEKKPVVASADTPYSGLLTLMKQMGISHIPIVDSEGVPQKLVSMSDLDDQILLSTPHMGEDELGFVNQAFETNWIAPLGPNVDAFEQELAIKVGVGHAAAVSSGTAAIHLSLILLGVGVGDKVFCSSLTFVASANPICYQGAEPVFIDSEPGSWNMSPQALEQGLEDCRKQNKLPKAVIVVNLYGQSADMDVIVDICDRYSVPVIEDAAESLGSTYKGKSSGTLARIGIYSFNGNKIITTSGGGMLISDDAELVERARFLATQARESAPWYQHEVVGYNYRMSNILAGVGRGQLKVLDKRVDQRRSVFDMYESSALSDLIEWMPEASWGRSNRWLTAGLFKRESNIDPQLVIERLAGHGIEARRVWKPLHLQPLFRGTSFYSHSSSHAVSEDLFERGVCLPSGSSLSAGQVDRVIGYLSEELKRL